MNFVQVLKMKLLKKDDAQNTINGFSSKAFTSKPVSLFSMFFFCQTHFQLRQCNFGYLIVEWTKVVP